MYSFLQASGVLLKDFPRYANGFTEQMRQRTEFLSRQADDELIARSQKAASHAPLRISDTARAIRAYRRKTKDQRA